MADGNAVSRRRADRNGEGSHAWSVEAVTVLPIRGGGVAAGPPAAPPRHRARKVHTTATIAVSTASPLAGRRRGSTAVLGAHSRRNQRPARRRPLLVLRWLSYATGRARVQDRSSA